VREGRTEGRTGRDTLDTTATRETTDSGLCDALDVVTEDLAVTFGAAFAEALAAFPTCTGDLSVEFISCETNGLGRRNRMLMLSDDEVGIVW